MPLSRAEIPTQDAPQLIERLCAQWAESQTVRRESERVCVIFAEGTCVLYPETEKLIVALESLEDELLDRLEARVDGALEALNDTRLDVVWET